jgi:hypothetical protein
MADGLKIIRRKFFAYPVSWFQTILGTNSCRIYFVAAPRQRAAFVIYENPGGLPTRRYDGFCVAAIPLHPC